MEDIGQKQFAEEDFVKMYSDWQERAWDELDWDRVKDLQVREILAQRTKMADIAQNATALACPNFLKHVSQIISLPNHHL